MFRIRTSLTVLFLIAVCAAQIAAWQGSQTGVGGSGPRLGKWKYTGKDSLGVVWTGTLTIGKVDPNRFDPGKYHSICSIEAQSEKGGLGVEHPGTYDASTRTLSFGNEGRMGGSVYTAVLSVDGKKLEKGKWRKSDRDFGSKELAVVTGEWSADLIEN